MSGTVLVVGGAGAFGSRLVERLAISCSCNILVVGRSHSKTAQWVAVLASRQPRATVRAWVIDREQLTQENLRAAGVKIVVDAAGPFQGQQPRLALTAIAAGCHFIDLADARDYVAAFPALQNAALNADVLAVCGASSVPSLSHAALDRLGTSVTTPEIINVLISPGNRAPRGVAVMQAILSYVGRPVLVREAGVMRTHPGWSLLHRRVLSGLEARWFSLCETPDLDLIPARFPPVRTARFYAGLELSILHWGLWALSLLVRARLLKSLVPYASPLHRIACGFERFGTDRGAMLVEVLGWDHDGCRVTAQWGLIAGAGDGPTIPTLPAVAMIRRLLSGEEARRGAQACVGFLPLETIVQEFAGLDIKTYQTITRAKPLFRRTLGNTFEKMPTAVQELHSPRGRAVFKGTARVDSASSALGTLLARLFHFPRPSGEVDVEVTLEAQANREIWRRRFGRSGFVSILTIDPQTLKLSERFGLLQFALNIQGHRDGLDMNIVGAKLGIVPLPRFLTPWTRAFERVDASGRFTFDVEIGLLGIGRLVRYRGWLKAQQED